MRLETWRDGLGDLAHKLSSGRAGDRGIGAGVNTIDRSGQEVGVWFERDRDQDITIRAAIPVTI